MDLILLAMGLDWFYSIRTTTEVAKGWENMNGPRLDRESRQQVCICMPLDTIRKAKQIAIWENSNVSRLVSDLVVATWNARNHSSVGTEA
jgi:hypothetical protein